MSDLRGLVGVIGLAAMLVIAGCGQAETATATLEVASVPSASIYVDGVEQGTSPATLTLTEGDHSVELRSEKFNAFETAVTLTANGSKKIDASLTPMDPSDPAVIAKLAAAQGVDVAPFVAPETTRGRSGDRSCAVLLWPSRDVRQAGLVNYAIEADETYAGDATLEFRHGRKVLYREAFTPETVTTVRSIPAEVLEAVKVGRKITWGLYFEDSRRPIKTDFRVVKRVKADRQLAKLSTSRHMARQPQITRDLMKAAILENNRLYTEALVANLQVAADHPGSTQPFRGIVTTLRRLDAENSELWAFVAPNVAGRGGHASASAGRTAMSDANITAWMPKVAVAGVGPATTADSGFAGKTTGPGGAGVTPPAQAEQPAESTGTAATPESGTKVQPTGGIDAMKQHIASAEEAAAKVANEAADARKAADDLQGVVSDAEAAAAQAEAAADAAEAAAQEARTAVEEATEPTREQQEEVVRTGMAVEEAREQLKQANDAMETAREAAQLEATRAAKLESEAAAQAAHVESLKQGLEASQPQQVTPSDQGKGQRERGEDLVPQSSDNGLMENAESARAVWEDAKAVLAEAQAALEANPSEETQAAFDAALESVEAAAIEAYTAQEELEAAKQVQHKKPADQVQKPAVK